MNLNLRELPKKVEAFFFAPASQSPFGVLRIGIALVLIAEALLIRNDLLNLFSTNGLVQGPLAEIANYHGFAPRLSLFADFLGQYGVPEENVIFWVSRIYFFSLIFLLFGLWTRAASVFVFFLHWTFANSGYSSAYGVDMYAHIFLFYCMFFPINGAYSLDRYLERVSGEPNSIARLSLRVMQMHLAISYLTSAYEKSLNAEWWNGAMIWGVLNMPGYSQFDMGWLATWPFIPKMLGWMTLAVEGLFFIFIWPRRTRHLWLLLTIGMHLGIMIFLRLHIFSALMCAILIPVFGMSADPRRNRLGGTEASLRKTSEPAIQAAS